MEPNQKPTKLKGLKVTRVALVDEGANPDAHVRFAKRNDPEAPETSQPAEPETGIVKRIIEAIAKAFGIQPVEKGDAQTFSEAQKEQKWERVSREAYDMSYVFMDSIRSIIYDDEADTSTKQQLMKKSISEFAAAFDAAITNWAAGKSAEVKTEEAVVLAIKRNFLKTLQAEPGIQQPDGDPENKLEPTSKGKEKPATSKGDSKMNLDTSKMTQEERAVYEDMKKRYGQQTEQPKTGAAEAPMNDPTPAPADKPDAAEGDVSKSMKEVQAELAELRKFKAEAEDRELQAIAKKYELIGQKPETLVPVLKSMKALGQEQYDAYIATLDASVKAVEESGAFGEIGKRGTPSGENGAWGKLEAAAQEIMKSKPNTTWNQAIDIACTTNPDLLKAYEESRA